MVTSRLLLFLVCYIAGGWAADEISDDQAAMAFLRQYGYANTTSDMEDGSTASIQEFQEAIRLFQRFANIQETGIADNATFMMMNTPRCGEPDLHPNQPEASRRKRYALYGTRWEKNNLTWRIIPGTSTPDLPAELVRSIMVMAMKTWADVSALTFQEVSGTDVDIDILFAAEANHGDTHPFDGPGGVLAHAFYPQPNEPPIAGDVHFDDAETYTHETPAGTNLLWVAVHEIGHSLGLAHSEVDDALMYPYYRGYNADLQLHRDDIAGIQAIYGNADDPDQPGETPGLDCNVDITWATSTRDGKQYLCNDTHCYRMSNNVVDAGYPKLIREEFPALPDGPDASFYYPQNMKTYVFKGSEVWRLTNQMVDTGYPRSISTEFPGIPNDLSAAFIWHVNGLIYFVKDTRYYRVSTPGGGVDVSTDNPYPRIFSDWWRGLPSTIEAAFQWSDSQTYMFAGTQYYKLHPWLSEVSTSLIPYPRETAVWWFNCDPDDGISDEGFNGAMPVAALSTVVVIGIGCLHAMWFRY